jgi:hypothetical protein
MSGARSRFSWSSPPRALGLWLVMASLATACASGNRHGNWSVNRSRHVALYTDAKLEHEYIQQWLELSHAAFQPFFPGVETGTVDAVWLKVEPGTLTRFYAPWDDPRAGWTLETLPSGGRIGKNGLIVLERDLEHRGMSFVGVRNENLAKEQMAHLFIMKAVPMAPLWVQVGLGRYLHKFRIHYQGDSWMACFGGDVFDEPMVPVPADVRATRDMPATVGVMAGGGRRVNLGIGRILHADWYAYDGSSRRWFEYTAYALIHYLIHGEKGFHRSRFPIFLQALRDGRSSEEALQLGYPHVLDDEWDDRLDAHVRPNEGRSRKAQTPTIPQGLCYRIPPARHAEKKPRREKASAAEIELLLGDLERVDPFRRFAGWWPQEIVNAEAAKRPGRGRGRGPGAGTESGASGRPAGAGTPGPSRPLPDDDTPTITAPATPPPATQPAPPPAVPPD